MNEESVADGFIDYAVEDVSEEFTLDCALVDELGKNF
jgi:hypothetical protein